MKVTKPPTREVEDPYFAGQRQKENQSRFDRLAKDETTNQRWVDAVTMTYEVSLRTTASACSAELKKGADILTAAGKAAAADDPSALAATYTEYQSHTTKLQALKAQAEDACK